MMISNHLQRAIIILDFSVALNSDTSHVNVIFKVKDNIIQFGSIIKKLK